MRIGEFIPSELLKPFVRTYRIIASHEELVNRVLPNTSLTIAFRYKGQVNYLSDNDQNLLPISTISGLRKSVRLIHYLKDTATIIVQFKEIGAKAFFTEPLYELFEESVSLHAFVKTNLDRCRKNTFGKRRHANKRSQKRQSMNSQNK